jgi:hypothetical protein
MTEGLALGIIAICVIGIFGFLAWLAMFLHFDARVSSLEKRMNRNDEQKSER